MNLDVPTATVIGSVAAVYLLAHYARRAYDWAGRHIDRMVWEWEQRDLDRHFTSAVDLGNSAGVEAQIAAFRAELDREWSA